MPPTLWIVAGPNGAGKTTGVQRLKIKQLLSGVRFLNPDDRTKSKLIALGYQGFADAPQEIQFEAFKTSANEVSAELEHAVENGEQIGIETVLSTDKYRALVVRVIELGGSLGIIYVALASPEIAIERVARRVSRGGHGVPADKITKRWQDSLLKLDWYLRHATRFFVYDNSASDVSVAGPRLVCRGEFGRISFIAEDCFEELRSALERI
ncbi:MAG: hypothetical protein JWM11_7481 [Planctomycetaceae bacterium]|nr:hypothetical protein [Planctomycetaceae bacterium]